MAEVPPPPKGWKVEYAKSGRAMCKTCDTAIAKDCLRIAKVEKSFQYDGLMMLWHHMDCIQSKPGILKSLDDIEGVDDIRLEDSQKLKKYVEDGGEVEEAEVEEDPAPGDGEYACEISKSSRAACKSCKEKISKGEVRVSTIVETGRFGKVPAWRHAKCFVELGWWKEPIEDLPGWENIGADNQKQIHDLVKTGNMKR
ncbi:hypothetical protein MPTK2_8g18050 [Marchantia polymorpha subsp. ruderalis]